MTRLRLELRDCRRVLVRGNRYVIGETHPDGFGIWVINGILPVATYRSDLAGWHAAVDHFLRLGDTPKPLSYEQRRRDQRWAVKRAS